MTHAFKEERVLRLHFEEALRFPVERVDFVGVDPGYMDAENEGFDGVRREEVIRGERERGYLAWEGDVIGAGEGLREKRRGRNSWGVWQGLFVSEGEREVSGLRTRVLEDGEEVLVCSKGERFPWEERV